ncbi:MAG: hypothetical protein ACD_58C00121G0003 [uncultured bacterium]|nr:MAG: hypothetical protein ACD_58C00121G0003 [uncultured bacterium]
MLTKPLVLLILDGWGQAPAWGGNAVTQAKTITFDQLWRQHPHTTLGASGTFVGLPGHEQGNSEVGHLNIGSGRVIYQDITRINKSIEDKSFFSNEALIKAIANCQKNNSNLHLMGLLSDGGVHSHINHLYALLDFVKDRQFTNKIYVHVFTDGRDTSPMSGLQYITDLENKMKDIGLGQIATISGRYWSMDRDKHWDRINQAYKAMVNGIGPIYTSASQAISENYRQGRTDEFIIPSIIVNQDQKPIGRVQYGDSLIFFNFRSDRARQITKAFCGDKISEFNRGDKIPYLYFVSIIPYGIERELGLTITPIFNTEKVTNTLAEVISNNQLKQFHIAETEKFAHVTYFFNGGQEAPFNGEDRLMIPSPKVATFDLKPEMSVNEVTQNVLDILRNKKHHLLVVNFANPDMVGHTGNLKAAIDACESVDNCLKQIYELVVKIQGILIVTADHGNVEEMLDPKTGEVDTEHSCNPVPFMLIGGPQIKFLKQNGVLADIAPTILKLMGIAKPQEMTGEPLISI